MSKEERFLAMAMGVSLTSKCRFKHGAVVVKHGRVRGFGTNIQKNDPKNVDYKHSSVHAEIVAGRKAGWPYKSTIYIARTNNLGQPRMSKPCEKCQAVLDEFKMRVVWTVG